MDVALGLAVGAGIPVGRIFGGSWAEGDEGSGCKISERVKKKDGGAEKALTRTWR